MTDATTEEFAAFLKHFGVSEEDRPPPPTDRQNVYRRALGYIDRRLTPEREGEHTVGDIESALNAEAPSDPYEYIPLPLDEFLDGLEILGPAEGRSFLDVGCGTGLKMVVALKRGFEVFGLDIYQPYLDVAASLGFGDRITLADAATFDGYGEFAVVYCYGPDRSLGHASWIRRRIADQMRPGTHLFAPSPFPPEEIEGATSLGRWVWRIN
jgi:SAM-dependent methyltransferase